MAWLARYPSSESRAPNVTQPSHDDSRIVISVLDTEAMGSRTGHPATRAESGQAHATHLTEAMPSERTEPMVAPVRIWMLQYGPCWCRTVPTDTSSFDFVRLRRTKSDLGALGENLLVVSDRVIDGSARVFRQVYQEVPEPKLVISAAACPSASGFWDELPNGWSPVEDVLSVDIEVGECISGHPEELMAAVLRHVLVGSEWGRPRQQRRMEEASTDA